MMQVEKSSVCIVGAGVTGCLAGVLLSKLGLNVVVFEAMEREEFFKEARDRKKIQKVILVSSRGLKGAEEEKVFAQVLDASVRLSKLVIHDKGGTLRSAFLGDIQASLRSVAKQDVHMHLLKHLESASVEIVCGHHVVYASRDGICRVRVGRMTTQRKFDLVIGADGLHSSVRHSMLSHERVDFCQQYLQHVTMELPVQSIFKRVCAPGDASHHGASRVSFKADYALPHPDGVHVWSSNGVTLTAVQNADKTFTAVLTSPCAGDGSLGDVDPDDDAQVYAFFAQHFPDIVPITPNICNDFRASTMIPVVRVRTRPVGMGCVVLLGSAAGSDFPLFGFPSDSCLQDALVLHKIMRRHLAGSQEAGGVPSSSPTAVVAEFSASRASAVDAHHELSARHYCELAPPTTSSVVAQLRRGFRTMLNRGLPHFFPTAAALLVGDEPYEDALARLDQQERWVDGALLFAGAAVVGLGVATVRWWTVREGAGRG
jgi:kynurenine 3-monooxygenase